MADDSNDDDDVVATEVFKAHLAHKKNKNGMFHFGTHQLVFPVNYDISPCKVPCGRFTPDTELNNTIDRSNSVKDMKYRLHWSLEHEPESFKSFPNLLTLLSIHGGTHPIIWNDKTHRNEYSEFLRPLRFACDGDMGLAVARFICDYIGNMEDICVYCFSHEDSDTCLKYWFPIQRHARLQSINYTMYRHMSFQICLSCFQREHRHDGWEQCEKRLSCCYCRKPGHHKSLCSSFTHHLQLAINRVELDKKNEKKPGMHCAKNVDIYLEEMYKEDFSRKAEVDIEVATRMNVIEDDIRSDSTTKFFDRLRLQEAFEIPVEKANKEPVPSCLDKPYADVHWESPICRLIEEHMILMNRFKCTDKLDRRDLAKTMRDTIKEVHEMFDCIRNCNHCEPASFFCSCGLLRLCYTCVVGPRDGDRAIVSPKLRYCRDCRTTIAVPKLRARSEASSYVETVKILRAHMLNLVQGLGFWSRSLFVSPDLVGWCREVVPSLANLFKLLECAICRNAMNHESRSVMKRSCNCKLMCKGCVIYQHLRKYVDHSDPPKCAEVILKTESKCGTCSEQSYTGTCMAISALARVVTYFYDKPVYRNERTLRDVMNDLAVSAGRARIQNLRYQETFAKQLAKSSHLQPQPQFAPYRQPLDDLDHQHMVDTLQSEQQADAAFDRQFQEVMVFGKKNNEHKKNVQPNDPVTDIAQTSKEIKPTEHDPCAMIQACQTILVEPNSVIESRTIPVDRSIVVDPDSTARTLLPAEREKAEESDDSGSKN